MSQWYVAASLSELPEGSMKGVELGGSRIFLVHTSTGIHAFENRCGHMSAPLTLGTFKSGVIKCALHSAVFDASSGAVRGPPQIHRAGAAQLPPEMAQALQRVAEIQEQIRTEPLHPFPVDQEGDQIRVYI